MFAKRMFVAPTAVTAFVTASVTTTCAVPSGQKRSLPSQEAGCVTAQGSTSAGSTTFTRSARRWKASPTTKKVEESKDTAASGSFEPALDESEIVSVRHLHQPGVAFDHL